MSADTRQWLAGLYQANFPSVFKRCARLLRSGEDAADAAHEVFLTALNSLAPDTEEKRARAWLLTVAQNHCLDLLRRRKRFGRALLTLGADEEEGDDVEAAVVDRDFVDNLLQQLSFRERMALWQSAVEHRPLADIASGLQLSYAAAAQVVHRARQHAVRLAAGAAAIIAGLRLPRWLRRMADRWQQYAADGEPMLAVHRLLAAAALPLIAAVTLATSTDSPSARSAGLPGPAAASGARASVDVSPGSVSGLLTPLGNPALGASPAAAPTGLVPSAAVPAIPSAAVKSMTDQIQQSLGQLMGTTGRTAPSPSPLPSLPGASSAAASALPSVPPAPSLPPAVP
jgi:RNA polymerase sigma-70 factor (ECF subfamily)